MITAIIHLSGSDCVAYYAVSYKLDSEGSYVELPNQFTSPITVPNLVDDSSYDIRIIKHCCDGSVSDPLDVPFLATIVAIPENFAVIQDGADVDGTWDAVGGATNYIAERADDAAFATNLVEVYSGATNSFTDNTVTTGTYYYRVKAQKTGQPDSGWAEDSVTLV